MLYKGNGSYAPCLQFCSRWQEANIETGAVAMTQETAVLGEMIWMGETELESPSNRTTIDSENSVWSHKTGRLKTAVT